MHDLIEVILAVFGVLGLGALAAAGVTFRRLLSGNRVAGRRTGAPLWWRWSPSAAGRLHRRLIRIGQIVVAVTGDGRRRRRRDRDDGSVLLAAAKELTQRAVDLDRHLVEIAGHGSEWRRLRLPELGVEVRRTELATAQLAELHARVGAGAILPAGALPLGGEAEDLLEAFAAALAEVQGGAQGAIRATEIRGSELRASGTQPVARRPANPGATSAGRTPR